MPAMRFTRRWPRGSGLGAIVSTDADFDNLEGTLRVDPRDREAVASLGREQT